MGIRLLVVQLGSLQDSQHLRGFGAFAPFFSPIAIPEGYPFRRSPGISGLRAVGLELVR